MSPVAELLPPSLFWDTNLDQLDWEQHAVFIVNRVVERGDYPHLKLLILVYGRKPLVDLLFQVPSLSPKTLHFLCAFFQLKPEKFQCYTPKQSIPNYWI